MSSWYFQFISYQIDIATKMKGINLIVGSRATTTRHDSGANSIGHWIVQRMNVFVALHFISPISAQGRCGMG